MAGKNITVVGGGLSGLTAAINLAREGFEVLVLEKEKRHGGRPEFRPDGAASPFDLAALEAYTGIDISPACKHMDGMSFQVYGKKAYIEHSEGAQMFLVERGSRSTSLDTLLYNLAIDAGVKFQWDTLIKTQSDVSELPEGSIIATGLEVYGFEAMGIPYVPFWGWFAKRMVDDDRTMAWAYIDDFTVDYAFTTQINGAAFALLFQRTRPLTREGKKKYVEFTKADGIEFEEWRDLYGGAAPHRSSSNPILFKNNMIVIGTLGGVMEPMLNFGMLGAMISGRIGATAATDRGEAYEEFRKLTAFFRWSLLLKKAHDACPPAARKAVWKTFAGSIGNMGPAAQNRAFRFVPGYRNF